VVILYRKRTAGRLMASADSGDKWWGPRTCSIVTTRSCWNRLINAASCGIDVIRRCLALPAHLRAIRDDLMTTTLAQRNSLLVQEMKQFGPLFIFFFSVTLHYNFFNVA